MNDLFSNRTKSKDTDNGFIKIRSQNKSITPGENRSLIEKTTKYNIELKNKQYQMMNNLKDEQFVKNVKSNKDSNRATSSSNFIIEKNDNKYDNKLTRTRLKLFVTKNDDIEENSANNNLYDVSKKIVKNNLISENLKNKFSEVFSQTFETNKSDKKVLTAYNFNKFQLKDNNNILSNNFSNNYINNLNNVLDFGLYKKRVEKG